MKFFIVFNNSLVTSLCIFLPLKDDNKTFFFRYTYIYKATIKVLSESQTLFEA